MAKFQSPTGSREVWITQTYHGESASNPNDLSKQCAIDLSMNGGSKFYSVCSGTVELTTTSGGGYISVIPTGTNFRVLYVHTKDWTVSKGQTVEVGQELGKIQTLSTGSHLHFGLKNISGLAPHPQPMDYFDRSIIFRTKYKAIRDFWFNGDDLSWGKFGNLEYGTFKVGDKIVITQEQNIRQGSGTSFVVTGNTSIGEVYEIENGPRFADGYTWYDLKNNNWVADVGKFREYTESTPTPAPDVPNCDEYIEKVKLLEEEVERLRTELEALKENTRLKSERIRFLEDNMKLREAEYKELENENKRLIEDLGLKNKTLEEKIKELSELKLRTESWVYRLADIVYNFFSKKTI